MLGNYLKTAIRSLLKNKVISLINMIGLAVGLAAFLIILSYTNHELSFDKFNAKADRIYRCVVTTKTDKGTESSPEMVAAIGPSLLEEFPEIEKMVRFREPGNRYLEFNNKAFFVKNVLYADSTLFDIFSFRLLKGNPKTALASPFSIVLSVKTAAKIFGTEDPVGKMISLDNKDLLTVTGVVEDAPSNSHIQYNAFISFSSLYTDKNMFMDWNGGWAYYTYVLMKPGNEVQPMIRKFLPFMDRHINYIYNRSGISLGLSMQPLQRIYLHSNLPGEIGPTGNVSYLILFSFTALLIFIIACINFMNLTAVRLTTRLHETGVRKILGATRMRIFLQFMTESVVMNLTALLLALIIAESLLPVINRVLDQNLLLYQVSSLPATLTILLIIILTGILAGSYPALYLTSFQLVETFRNTIPVKPGKINLRRVTVLLQYTISVTMVICTLFLYKQLFYIGHKDPGFERNNVLVIPLATRQVSGKHMLLKSVFSEIPGIDHIAVCSDYPGRGLTKNGFTPEGQTQGVLIHVIDGDEDLLSVLGLKIVRGRNFSRSLTTDSSKYLVNEAFARSLNWMNPEGKYIERNGKHEIIGVVRDFNFAPLHESIAPLIISMIPEDGQNFMLLKVKNGEMDPVLKQLKIKWEGLIPEVPFEHFYLQEAAREVYKTEHNLSTLTLLFTCLAMLIAFLGLFALSSYETERQTKNIGIRKVNGATSFEIMIILSGDFTRLVGISFIIACPIGYYIMNKWLQHFAYKTALSGWIFLLACFFTLVITWITISWQSLMASRRDPVTALKYE
jgi:putative ABC transport system permease protein